MRATALRSMRPCALSASKLSQSAPKTTLALKAGEKPSMLDRVPLGVSYRLLGQGSDVCGYEVEGISRKEGGGEDRVLTK